jgi:hypothetical protein
MDRAIAIDKEAALKSASYGRFQTMGNNYKSLWIQLCARVVDAMKISSMPIYLHLSL